MGLSHELISQFAKITKSDKKENKETTVYGKAVVKNGVTYVQIDGSDRLTPMSTTTEMKDGERVTATIKNHTVTVTGNVSSPAARTDDVKEINNKVTAQDNTITAINNKVEAHDNTITSINNTVTEIGNTVNSQGNQITRLNDTINSQGNTIESLNNKVTAQGNDITAIDNAVKSQGNQITSINNTVTSQGNQIKQINDKVVSQGNTITSQGNQITEIDNTIESQDNQIKQINDKVVSQGNTITSQGNQITEIDNTVNSQGNTIDSLNNKVEAHDNAITSINNDIEIYNSSFQITDGVVTGIKGVNSEWIKTSDLEADHASITDLKTNKADIDLANVNNAWIQNGIIKDGSIGEAAIHEGAITNAKIADATIEAAKIKSINADNITAGTLKTDRLIITGPDGQDSIVKAINTANGISEADVNSQKIQAASIDVGDLSAFEATLAQFEVSGNAIYSGKESIKDPNSGIYISTTGIGMGDGSLTGKDESPLQMYADGSFKLDGKNSSFDFNTVTGELNIEATNLKISSKTVATKDDIDEVRDEITTLLRIESSRGTVFKNNAVATVLSVVIYHGKQRITDSDTMKSVFGNSAYLQWKWQRLDDKSFGVLSTSDTRFGDNGFTFTLSPEDVDTKVTFMCELIT